MKKRVANTVVIAITIFCAMSSPLLAVAQTTTETTVTISTEDVGSFSVSFVQLDGGYEFVDEFGANSLSVTALEGDIAFATAKLAWTDTRANGQRLGYTFTLSADDLTSEVESPTGVHYTIPASNLAIVEIAGQATSHPLPLGQPQTVISVESDPPIGEQEITLKLELMIDPSTYPTTYTTTLRLEVIHDNT